jgi:hypothetical protein
MILAFLGSCEDEKFNTRHPGEGGIILTAEWPDSETAPATYRACVLSQSGVIRDFGTLSGTTNSLVVEPGDATLYIYNNAEHIIVSDDRTTATVGSSGTGIAPNPGIFFSYCEQLRTEQDEDLPHTALMNRRTGDLKLSLAIKPAAMISRVRAVYAELQGAASTVNLQTGALSNPSSVAFPLPRNAFYAAGTVRLPGFVPSATKSIRLDVEFDNGNTARVTDDLSSLLIGFDASTGSLFTLNATLSVSPDGSGVTVDGWECNAESRYLSLSASEVNLPEDPSAASVTVTTDRLSWEYSVVKTGDWLTVDKSGDRLNLSASANTDTDERRATINVSAGGLNESVTIIQTGYTPPTAYADREVVKLQSATVGRGVNLVLMGDGYTAKDMGIGNGKYEQDMRTATESFFAVYPYTVYRNHFNVYMVAAVSNEEGVSNELNGTKVDTKFECSWEGYGSTGISCNAQTVVDYVGEVSELNVVRLTDITVILPINANIYAGTCYMFPTGVDPASGNGFSISLCPTGYDFRNVVAHEAGGHGFAKLMDEYIYYWDETIPDGYKNSFIDRKRSFGWYENVDFYDDIRLTTWSGFAGNPKYGMVGTFEGAYMYGLGIWRPEYDSCMNENILYFNAPSRWAQVRRIKWMAGFDYSFQQFLLDDVVPEYPPSEIRSRPAGEEFIPLAPPVVMDIKDTRRGK